MTTPPIAKGKTREHLIDGLPSKIRLVLDWDGACDLSADRRNCIIHRALLHKDEITRPTVGTDKVTFIWRGDARIEVIPNAQALMALLRNDEAAAGEREWPTGQQTLYLPLDQIKVRDLRPAREWQRNVRKSNESYRAMSNASSENWKRNNPEARRKSQRDYQSRRKTEVTKSERGRFILS